jgi:hypothetical protein
MRVRAFIFTLSPLFGHGASHPRPKLRPNF